MRIVHVVYSLDVGGQERLILQLGKTLLARGHDVRIVSLTPGGALVPQFGDMAIDWILLDRGAPRTIADLARHFRRHRFDAVHTHNPPPFFTAVPAARLARVPAIVHTKHGANIYGPKALWASRLLCRATTAFVAVSPGTAQVARRKERVDPSRLHTIENGIPLGDFGPNPEARAKIRNQLGIPLNATVVGSVGRLATEKNYGLFLRAMAPLVGPNVHVLLVGEGADRPTIERAISPNMAPYVHLTGMRSDVPDLLAAMDVFTLTSKTEGLPLAIPEAMASGLGIVATRVGGIPDIVPEGVGTLVDSEDEQGLTAAYGAFLADESRRRQAGSAARKLALERFSIESMADAYERLYALGRRRDNGL